MNTKAEKQIKKYFQLRDEIDNLTKSLVTEHKIHLKCKTGCDLCCMDYNIFPLEFYFILNELHHKNFKPDTLRESRNKKGSCVFLKNHKCSIYPSRPIICRTHGLPLLYMNNDEWEISTCELNFIDFDFGQFSIKNTFAQDKYNSKLFLLNRNFIANFSDKKYDEMELIPLGKLIEYL